MTKSVIPFEDFLKDADPAYHAFLTDVDREMREKGCKVEIKTAKSGYVLTYADPKTQKALMNYVFRKRGMLARIYGDHAGAYEEMLAKLPENMVKAIEKAPPCKRLLDPAKCNSRCAMGYQFALGGETHKKCRYSGFMFDLTDENNTHIKTFVENELAHRMA